MNRTECIAYIKGAEKCGRGIKVGKLPEKTICRKWLKHMVSQSKNNGGERHFLQNAAGKMFDVTDEILKQAKEAEE